MKYLEKLLERGHNVWSISCSWHATAFMDNFFESVRERVPEGGRSMQSAVYDFVMKGEKVVDIDVEPWPANRACAR